ncbi:unnamed protein product, partial [Nesidiocoris tenuis]
MKLYLKLTGADRSVKIGDEPTLDVLKTIVRQHVMSVPYQNYTMLVTRKPVDFGIPTLMKTLLVDKIGGSCYEMCEFMLFILRSFNFDARRISTYALVNNEGYTDDAVYNHSIIFVLLDGKKYLIDVGFSLNSLREPVEFNFERTEEKSVTPAEKYLLDCNDDHFKLSLWLKEAWAPMYRFRRPLQFKNEQELRENYLDFMTTPSLIFVRDKTFKFGTVTATGRIGCSCPFDSFSLKATPPYTVVYGENHERPTSRKVSYKVFQDTVKKYANLSLNDDYFAEDES